MKKLILFLPIILLIGCTNTVEENKYSYLEYKSELQKEDNLNVNDNVDFNIFFNIIRENNEIVNYSVTITNPIIDMKMVKALLIHDYMQDDVFPSVGIFDDPINLEKDSTNKIVLQGKIQTTDDISNVNFKLYLEYIDDDGNINKIYSKVSRG